MFHRPVTAAISKVTFRGATMKELEKDKIKSNTKQGRLGSTVMMRQTGSGLKYGKMSHVLEDLN